jgi:hypothetical protein
MEKWRLSLGCYVQDMKSLVDNELNDLFVVQNLCLRFPKYISLICCKVFKNHQSFLLTFYLTTIIPLQLLTS